MGRTKRCLRSNCKSESTPSSRNRPGILNFSPSPSDEEEELNPAPATYVRYSGRTLTWDECLESVDNLTRIPSVSFFHCVPGSSIWDEIAVPGVVIELRNPFADCKTDVFWVATVVYFAGYFALVEFERFGEEPSQLSWISFLSDNLRPVGWCRANGKVLYPGKVTAKAHPDYLKKLEVLIQGKPTISADHVEKFSKEISSMIKFNLALPVEAVDYAQLSRNRIGRITAVCGDRFHVQYVDTAKDEGGNWFTAKSDLVHPLGWSGTIGQELVGPISGLSFPHLPQDNFHSYPPELQIRVGMCLETRHPELPHKIVGAEIVKVLREGYFILKTCDSLYIDRCEFCCHVTSPYIFPVGWAKRWRIECENNLAGTVWRREFLQLELLPKRLPHHFQAGMLVEAIDITQLAFCGPATIYTVAEHMLLLHFINWSLRDEKNFVWVDAQIGDIYPIGYSELIGLEFQGHV